MKTILLVDDEETKIEFFKKYFSENLGKSCHILSAINGIEAVEIMSRESVDFVFTNVNMPKMNGLELLTYIKDKHPKVPVAVNTAYSTPEMFKGVMDMGAWAFLPCPITVEELEQLTSKIKYKIGLTNPKNHHTTDSDFFPIPDHFKKTVIIPVRIKKGKLEWFYEGEMPELIDDVIADLTVPYYAIKDKEMRFKLSAEEVVVILPKDTRLLAELSVRDTSTLDDKSKKYLREIKENEMGGHRVLLRGKYAEFSLKEPLQMILRGTKKSCLKECLTEIPFLECEALSIHHAYSLLSEKFETHRRTHGANVFNKVFFEKDNLWFPLDYLRGQFEANDESLRYMAD